MKKMIFMFVIVVATTVSCKKNNDSIVTVAICTTAVVKYGGDISYDGVGWYLLVQDSSGAKPEYPDNLAGKYKIDGLAVNVCYKTTDNDFPCFCAQPYPKKILITSISKR